MIKQMKATVCILATALMFGTAATQAGTLTIYNKNCTKSVLGLWPKKQVTVHVYGQLGCKTDTNVTIPQDGYKTVTLDDYYLKPSVTGPPSLTPCKYKHEATGTVGGKRDVLGTEDSSVTCKKAKSGYCICNKY